MRSARPARDGGFLNVDLEIGASSRIALAPLIDALEGRLVELFRGRIRRLYRVHYEGARTLPDASAAIDLLAAAIERLPRQARRAWDRAALRDFNVGVELARGARGVELAIDRDAVARVAALGARIAFTAYRRNR